MSISRISNSIVSGANENTLALVNFNIDFSLLKLEAPQEFSGLGLSLTRQRRELAEDGPVHRTARRLGALFENIVPSSPTLIRAYGSRVSEISQATAKEDALQRQGVFAECAGVDGTSVWAAATSGKSAISLHLLACMLARSWSGPEATSIWVEIVEEQKRSLRKQINDGLYDSSVQLGLAVGEDISRRDLAHWDASTRAWLQVADDNQIRRQKQLMLIINNVNIPVNQGNARISTYSRVIEAWKTGVVALEKLFNGQSQSISKGAVLLGLASWHLYPRLLVLGDKIAEVEFRDEVINNSGQLTIGLQDPDSNKDEGVYWSLSLAHLRFYGDPVQVVSFTTRDASRLNIREFHLLVFGAILSHWGSIRPSDFEDAAKFFVALNASLCDGYKRRHAARMSQEISVSTGELCLNWEYGWIRLMGQVCSDFLTLRNSEKTIATSIIALGHRRGNYLLSPGLSRNPPPMMGLSHSWIQYMLTDSTSEGRRDAVGMMRYIAERLGLRHDQCLIKVNESHEYITAIPHEAISHKDESTRKYHVSWHKTLESEVASCDCTEHGRTCYAGGCACVSKNRICTSKCHQDHETHRLCEELAAVDELHLPSEKFEKERTKKTAGAHLDAGVKTYHYFRSSKESWKSAINLDQTVPITQQTGESSPNDIPHQLFDRHLCSCFHEDQSKSKYTLIVGNGTTTGLYARGRGDGQQEIREVRRAIRKAGKKRSSSIREVTEMLESRTIAPDPLLVYMESLYSVGKVALPEFGSDLTFTTHDVKAYLRSLHAVSLASKAYSDLPGSTISLQLISQPLHQSKWLPDLDTNSLTRQQKFACIAMFESGLYNVEPGELNDVIAVSSRNSIFVSKLLLEDPESLDQVDAITRVVGNVGKTGMVFMVAPQAPRLRKVELDDYRLVTHAPFDGKLENCFQATSLHLRFTEFEMPFNVGQRGAIDKDLCLVETLIQVFDREKWVADIDILPLFDKNNDLVRRNRIKCTGCSSSKRLPRPLRSIDNWEELLDTGESLGALEVGVFRANDNWLARLAAACVSLQKGYRTVINPSKGVCWSCTCRQDWSWKLETMLEQRMRSQRSFGDEHDLDSDTDLLSPEKPRAPTFLEEEVLDGSTIYEGCDIFEDSDNDDNGDSFNKHIGKEHVGDSSTPFQGSDDEEDESFGNILPQIVIV